MALIPDYVLKLKSFVMISQVDLINFKLEDYVHQLEETIKMNTNTTMQREVELNHLQAAYQIVLDELLGT